MAVEGTRGLAGAYDVHVRFNIYMRGTATTILNLTTFKRTNAAMPRHCLGSTTNNAKHMMAPEHSILVEMPDSEAAIQRHRHLGSAFSNMRENASQCFNFLRSTCGCDRAQHHHHRAGSGGSKHRLVVTAFATVAALEAIVICYLLTVYHPSC